MSIEKINAALPVKQMVSFKGSEGSAAQEIPSDEEKSLSMKKMVGLGALAAITIGGIILYARKGKAPKTSSNVSATGGGGASSSAQSTTSAVSDAPVFEPVKKFMKKLEDGTEYLFRTEERDKDGNLIKTVRYAKDGKTIERVREFKMAPAGVTDPAHNVVASEIRYGKNGEVIYKRTAHSDGSGFDLEKFADIDKTIWGKLTYVTHLDGKRFRSVETSGVVTDAKTGRKIMEVQFGPKGEDDMVLIRRFDKKTGTKVVHEMQRISDDTYKATEFGQGQSRRVSIFKEIPGQEDKLLQFEQYDANGRLRNLYMVTQDGSFTRFENPIKGRVTICEEINGVKYVSKKYTKDGETYTQKFIIDDANPENNRIEVYKGEELVHTVGSNKNPNISSSNINSANPQRMIDIVFSRKVDANDIRNIVARTSPDGTREWNSTGELLRDGDIQYRYQGELIISGSEGKHAWRTLDFGNGHIVSYMKLDGEWVKTGENIPIH